MCPVFHPEDPDLPECLFVAAGRLIIFDHFTHTIKVAAFAYLNGNEPLERAYEYACREVEETISELQRPLADHRPWGRVCRYPL